MSSETFGCSFLLQMSSQLGNSYSPKYFPAEVLQSLVIPTIWTLPAKHSHQTLPPAPSDWPHVPGNIAIIADVDNGMKLCFPPVIYLALKESADAETQHLWGRPILTHQTKCKGFQNSRPGFSKSRCYRNAPPSKREPFTMLESRESHTLHCRNQIMTRDQQLRFSSPLPRPNRSLGKE